MEKRVKKNYGKCFDEIDVCSRVSTIQLFDRSVWINLQNGMFQEKVTGDKQNITYLYRHIWRGMIPNAKGDHRIVCSRRWTSNNKYTPLKQITWKLKK